jgi:hypothetical protein
VKGGEIRRIWVNVNNPSSPTSSFHENILETLDEGRGEKKNLGKSPLVIL